jgi:hypothetical protein
MGVLQEKPTQITEEELKELNDLQQTKQNLIFSLGELEYEKLRLEAQKQHLENQFNLIVQNEFNLSQQISERYGNSKVNLKTGELTPISN